MSQPQEIMSFRYRALFQALDIRFLRTQLADGNFSIRCEAQIKLPILKKNYQVSTDFLNEYLNWQKHRPVSEVGAEIKIIEKNSENNHAIDPVGFFMHLDQAEWTSPDVNLLIGNKQVVLSVTKTDVGYLVQRKDKDQKLIVCKNKNGIEKIEIPVPVIGAVFLERIF
ncbi:hypothetical protein K2X05_00395 [bacterium]|nr:hypothetical protein [bacterium]